MDSKQITGPKPRQEAGASTESIRITKRTPKAGKEGLKSATWKKRIRNLLDLKGDVQNRPWNPYMVYDPTHVTRFHSGHRIELQQVRSREDFAKWAISEVTRDMGNIRVIGHVTPEEVDSAIRHDAQHDVYTEV